MIINDHEQKLELEYPCQWRYKIIGESHEMLQQAIYDVITEREHTLENSHTSKSGKYLSLNLDMLIQNEDERQYIYKALKAHNNIKMVL